MTDCRPVSLFSVQTARRLGEEVGGEVDKRRFRANIYLDLATDGFAEDAFVGHTIRIGAKALIAVTDRDPRCKMVTLDPDTAEQTRRCCGPSTASMATRRASTALVLVEGTVRPGDEIVMAD